MRLPFCKLVLTFAFVFSLLSCSEDIAEPTQSNTSLLSNDSIVVKSIVLENISSELMCPNDLHKLRDIHVDLIWGKMYPKTSTTYATTVTFGNPIDSFFIDSTEIATIANSSPKVVVLDSIDSPLKFFGLNTQDRSYLIRLSLGFDKPHILPFPGDRCKNIGQGNRVIGGFRYEIQYVFDPNEIELGQKKFQFNFEGDIDVLIELD